MSAEKVGGTMSTIRWWYESLQGKKRRDDFSSRRHFPDERIKEDIFLREKNMSNIQILQGGMY